MTSIIFGGKKGLRSDFWRETRSCIVEVEVNEIVLAGRKIFSKIFWREEHRSAGNPIIIMTPMHAK